MNTKKNIFFILIIPSITIFSCLNKNHIAKKNYVKNENTEIKKSKDSVIISSYYQEKIGKFMYVDRIVLHTSGKNVIGYYGWAAQGEAEYYIVGKLNRNEINGVKYSLYDSTSESFKLTINSKSIKGLSFVNEAIPKDPIDLFNYENGNSSNFNLYKAPNLKSKILRRQFILSNKGFKLIEIGKMEKNNVGNTPYNIWYKVRNDEIEGWVYGLISVLH
jgi:hypothetical protein